MVKHNNETINKSKEVTVKKVLKIIGFVILGILFVISIGFVVMSLWNWLMPMIFDLPKITYWQGIGLLILAKILFGGIGGSSNDSKESSSRSKKEIHASVGQANPNYQENISTNDEALAQEEAYDTWWVNEGEQLFENYMKKEAVEREKI